jgi:hypothetical protein
MDQPFPNMRIIRLPRWVGILVVALVLGLAAVALFLAASVALVLIPVVAVAGLVARWRLKGRVPQRSNARTVIDGDYRVLDSGRHRD